MKPYLPGLLLLCLAALGRGGEPEPRRHAQGTPVPAGATLPAWSKPTPAELSRQAPKVTTKDLELVQSSKEFGGFVIRVAGQPMAIGQNQPMIGYVTGGQLRWLALAQAPEQHVDVKQTGRSVRVEFQCADLDGGHWHLIQLFQPGRIGGAIEIRSEISVDKRRSVAFLPMLMVFPGAGSFGSTKGQGLLAGLEYLEDEPSSSEADIIGPGARRQVPDNLKLTFPLMVIQQGGRYVALTWQMRPQFCALYDSPDRFFGSGGHVMGILYPGSDGQNREEGSLLAKFTDTLEAGQVVELSATLLGGLGQSVVLAVQQYVSLRGLPIVASGTDSASAATMPGSRVELQPYLSNAAGGWLDSKLREGKLFRHALWGNSFPPGPAADAAMWMDWLAGRTHETGLAERLSTQARDSLAVVAPADWNFAGVGHERYPAPALCYGHVAEAAAHAEQAGQALLARFEPDLTVKYSPHAGGPDYSKTHYSKEANGYTSRPVLDLLEDAAFSGQPQLLEAALARLRAMDKFRNGVPRGAQTWECPLHIPDILASAQMVRAYTLGYELTGEAELLEQARYWAWTGVPFVYLVNPTSQPIGLYATIAVFGATQWRAPVWLGLPVQWCGLVYADALYQLVRDDPRGPWKRLADGITLSGIEQSWPASDVEHQGLLPDSFVLRTQHRNGPAINPATVQACAVRFFGQAPVYDFWCARNSGLRVHAPGAIQGQEDRKDRVRFQVSSWVRHPYYVLINGLSKKPALRLNGKAAECAEPNLFEEKAGRLILKLEGQAQVELQL